MSLPQTPRLIPDDPERAHGGPVTCLGQTFPSDEARRAHFRERLRAAIEEVRAALGGLPWRGVGDAEAHLDGFEAWPMGEERQVARLAAAMAHAEGEDLLQRWEAVVGFPQGDIETILRRSDPPYYTICPNPFLHEWIAEHGTPFDPHEPYHREPFAVDVSEGKTDQVYRAHSYHTKVPHRAIMPAILHYTQPGEVVLDGFAGSGMVGVAAQMLADQDPEWKLALEQRWKKQGLKLPEWGARRVVLNDLGPAATFIAANYNLPFDVSAFERAAQRLLDELQEEIGWMYETRHEDGRVGQINYTVWSEVFSCPNCGGEVVFLEEALNERTGRTRKEFACPHCATDLTKRSLERLVETLVDAATGESWQRIRLVPVLINYGIDNDKFEKELDEQDRETLRKIEQQLMPSTVPITPLPIEQMYHGSRLAPKGVTRIHHLFLPRAAQALGSLWQKATAVEDTRLRNMLLY
ncbi:MAG: site-specific DNA-methyltransferase, partial [Chloroflexota bacterium]|nr:site-specific DNA-methyltransferase [Chloroflexota bacterium]